MFSAFFINRPKFALVISIVISLAGLIALNALPIAEYPDIAPPQVKVSTSYPGANATVVEQSVASPIEAKVNGVDNMLYMSSTSGNDGSYELTITFAVGTDPDIAAVNVQNRVATANSSLPQDVIRQGVITQKQSTSMLLVINLVSPDESKDSLFLSNYASINIQDALARINGVGSVSQFGALDYGMRIWLDPDKLTALELTTKDISNAIESQNIQATAGQLGAPPFEGTPQFQYTLQAKGRLTSVPEFEQIVVRANRDGSGSSPLC
ncbi:efflux RND transporter permease subunit [Kiloniella sp.]|uniref:efflux RND transporter permease subunit n=2 Tax=Kiloniella sp. TaxID=1938587 RepID=UPI003B02053C